MDRQARDFLNFGPGPGRSGISPYFPVLARLGPRTGPNRLVLDQLVLVRGSLVSSEILECSEKDNLDL